MIHICPTNRLHTGRQEALVSASLVPTKQNDKNDLYALKFCQSASFWISSFEGWDVLFKQIFQMVLSPSNVEIFVSLKYLNRY